MLRSVCNNPELPERQAQRMCRPYASSMSAMKRRDRHGTPQIAMHAELLIYNFLAYLLAILQLL